jgi:hypothetical protein
MEGNRCMPPQPFILRSDLDIVGDLEERSCYSYYGEPQLSPKMSDLTFEAVGINHSRSSCGEEISDDSILSIREEGKYVESIDVRQYGGITDIDLLALRHGCGQLQTINLSRCRGITDICVSALGRRCGLLRTIDLSGCHRIKDISMSALGHGCDQLQMISLDSCNSHHRHRHISTGRWLLSAPDDQSSLLSSFFSAGSWMWSAADYKS